MPKISLTPDNRVARFNDYPQLKFQNKDAQARVVLLENDPEVTFVHSVRAPELNNGEVVRELDKNGNKVIKYEFMGRYLCLGNFDVLSKKEADVENCPFCAVAVKSDIINKADRRYALHVIQYNTKPGSFRIADPFVPQLKVWQFANKVFNSLIEAQEEWEDLRTHDLNITCENPQFQKLNISVAATAEWLANAERKTMVTEMFKNNACSDVEALMGNKISRERATEIVDVVRERNDIAFRSDKFTEAESGLLGDSSLKASAKKRSELPVESLESSDDSDSSGTSSDEFDLESLLNGD